MPKNSLLRRAVDLVFGYDFFVSYAHADGKHYPAQLAAQLERSGFRTFLDTRVYVAGDELNAATRRRVRQSKFLIIVARPAAMNSAWVSREVQACLAAGRKAIVIDINGTFQHAEPNNPLKRLLADHKRIIEQLEDLDAAPTPSTLEQLRGSFQATRQDTVRLRVVTAVAFLLLVLFAVSLWMFRRSEVARKIAIANQIEAEKNLAQSHIARGVSEIKEGNYARGVSYFFAAYDSGQTKKHEPFPSSARNLR